MSKTKETKTVDSSAFEIEQLRAELAEAHAMIEMYQGLGRCLAQFSLSF